LPTVSTTASNPVPCYTHGLVPHSCSRNPSKPDLISAMTHNTHDTQRTALVFSKPPTLLHATAPLLDGLQCSSKGYCCKERIHMSVHMQHYLYCSCVVKLVRLIMVFLSLGRAAYVTSVRLAACSLVVCSCTCPASCAAFCDAHSSVQLEQGIGCTCPVLLLGCVLRTCHGPYQNCAPCTACAYVLTILSS